LLPCPCRATGCGVPSRGRPHVRYVKNSDGSFARRVESAVLARTGSVICSPPRMTSSAVVRRRGAVDRMADSTGVGWRWPMTAACWASHRRGWPYRHVELRLGAAVCGRVPTAIRCGSATPRAAHSVTGRGGAITRYGYDGSGPVESITDADGHQLVHNTYDSAGRVTAQTDATGATTRWPTAARRPTSPTPTAACGPTSTRNALLAAYDPYGARPPTLRRPVAAHLDDRPLGNTTTTATTPPATSPPARPLPSVVHRALDLQHRGDLASYTSRAARPPPSPITTPTR